MATLDSPSAENRGHCKNHGEQQPKGEDLRPRAEPWLGPLSCCPWNVPVHRVAPARLALWTNCQAYLSPRLKAMPSSSSPSIRVGATSIDGVHALPVPSPGGPANVGGDLEWGKNYYRLPAAVTGKG